MIVFNFFQDQGRVSDLAYFFKTYDYMWGNITPDTILVISEGEGGL